MDYLFDLSQATNFSQLPDEDFLALLQKQFPTGPVNGAYDNTMGGPGINPQTLNLTQLPSLSPQSDDSSNSPSPPRTEENHKRKASDDDEFEPGPSSKTQHTAPKKTTTAATTKRKTSGSAGNSDESRLLKRKEQNRAAQRAFRERKEKHVKDLEDKVAELEARNSQAISENENLKDLLTRLQNENMALKQSSFTFSVPKTAASQTPAQSPQNMFTSPYMSPNPFNNRAPTNALDLSSLTSFDPNMLSLLDEPAPTATSASSSLASDYGFSTGTDSAGFLGNFKTIASNPMFMSLSSYFDEPLSAGPASVDMSAMAMLNASPQLSTSPPSGSQQKDTLGAFDFDLNGLTTWPANGPTSNSNNSQPNFSTDDLFASWGMLGTTPSTSSISPIVHQASPPNIPPFPSSASSSSSGIGLGQNFARAAASSSSDSSSSSSSSAGASPASHDASSATSVSDAGMDDVHPTGHHNKEECPKTKEEFKDRISAEGPSPFAPTTALAFPNSSNPLNGFPSFGASSSFAPSSFATGHNHNNNNNNAGKIMACSNNSHFPITDKSENNVEVMSAWKTIISDPNHKSVDINLLCSEFSSKARCDGSKVVLKPEGLEDIKKLVAQQQQQSGGF